MFALIAVAGCGSSSGDAKFGKVAEDGLAAIKHWCGNGKFELQSKLDTTSAKSARENPNLLVYRCWNNGAPEPELGWVAIDSKTNELLELTLELHPSTADALIERVLVPALSERQMKGLSEVKASVAAGKDGAWRSGNTFIGINRNAGSGEGTHLVIARHKD